MNTYYLKQTTGIITSIVLMTGVAIGAEVEHANNPSSAKHFLTEAAEGGLAEVNLGQMAADKGENEAVKEFGRRMVRDHGKANEEIKKLATTVGVPLPNEMSPEGKALMQRLGNLAGAEFDRTYMEEMVKDHKKDIVAFEKQAEQGQDAQVKDWAKKTLPTLKEHLTLAQSTAKRVSAKTQIEPDASGGMRVDVDFTTDHEGKSQVEDNR